MNKWNMGNGIKPCPKSWHRAATLTIKSSANVICKDGWLSFRCFISLSAKWLVLKLKKNQNKPIKLNLFLMLKIIYPMQCSKRV